MILDEDKEFLEHYGVKGMKWGVRKGSRPGDRNPKGKDDYANAKKANKASAKARKADAKWAKNATSLKTQVKVYTALANEMDTKGLPKLNSDPAFQTKNGKGPLQDRRANAYIKAHDKIAQEALDKVAPKVIGKSPNGTNGVDYSYSQSAGVVATIRNQEVKHSDELIHGGLELKMVVKDGRYVSVKKKATGTDVLEHRADVVARGEAIVATLMHDTMDKRS